MANGNAWARDEPPCREDQQTTPRQGEQVPLRRLFDAFMVGVFATFLLPFRAGEFVRPYYLKRYSHYSFLTCFVSVVVERFFDLATVLLGFAVMLVYVPHFQQ